MRCLQLLIAAPEICTGCVFVVRRTALPDFGEFTVLFRTRRHGIAAERGASDEASGPS